MVVAFAHFRQMAYCILGLLEKTMRWQNERYKDDASGLYVFICGGRKSLPKTKWINLEINLQIEVRTSTPCRRILSNKSLNANKCSSIICIHYTTNIHLCRRFWLTATRNRWVVYGRRHAPPCLPTGIVNILRLLTCDWTWRQVLCDVA